MPENTPSVPETALETIRVEKQPPESILNQSIALARFQLMYYVPPDDLSPFVEKMLDSAVGSAWAGAFHKREPVASQREYQLRDRL
jgi:hypothetical protein